MKAFKKWIATKKLGIYIQDLTDRFHAERRYKEGWRAALKQVQKWCKELDDRCCMDCGCFSMVDDKIEEELEEE